MIRELDLSNDSDIEYDVTLINTEGTSNKFHFFAMFFDPDTELYVGANAYGRIGKGAKVITISSSPAKNEVMRAVLKKQMAKQRKGYYEYDYTKGIVIGHIIDRVVKSHMGV